jgi:hypothetical protein
LKRQFRENLGELSGGAVKEISMMMSGTLGWEGSKTVGKEKANNDKKKFDRAECDRIK